MRATIRDEVQPRKTSGGPGRFAGLCLVFVASMSTAAAVDAEKTPRERFMEYFQAMENRQRDVAAVLKTPDFRDTLHMTISKFDLAKRLRPFYQLSTGNRALVVAQPLSLRKSVPDRKEVIYAELRKHEGRWRIQNLARTSPHKVAWLMKGFQVHPEVKLDISPQALVGEWEYPCDSTLVLTADGTGSDFEVGPIAPDPDQKPVPLKWRVDGSTLVLEFEDRKVELTITSVDHEGLRFRALDNMAKWTSLTRKRPAASGGSAGG